MARHVLSTVAALAALAAGPACYAPTFADCAYVCAGDMDCPEGLACDATQHACRMAGATGACPARTSDAGVPGDAPVLSDGTTDAHGCSLLPSYGPTIGSGTQVAVNLGSDGPGDASTVVEWDGQIEEAPVSAFLIIETLSGTPTDVDWPVSLGPKSGLDLSTAPDVGVAIETVTGSGATGDLYIATTGTLNLTAAGSAVGDTFAGTATGMSFTHSDPMTGMPSPDGCKSSMAMVSFSVALTPAPTP